MDDKLERAPYPGELGERILNEITKTRWQEWVNLQTMLINEKGLSAIRPQDRQYLKEQMEKFLFGDGDVDQPAGYVPQAEVGIHEVK